MFYRNRYVFRMDRVIFPNHIFYLIPAAHSQSHELAAFLSGTKSFSPLKAPAEGGAVYLMEEAGAVLKCNRLKGLKKRIVKHFGLLGGERHYCLTNELVNLCRLCNSKIVPQVYGFGRQRRGLVRDEFLLIEHFQSMQTVDEFVLEHPASMDWVLEKVVDLFSSNAHGWVCAFGSASGKHPAGWSGENAVH